MSLAWNDSKHALPETRYGPGVLLKSVYSRRFLMFAGRKLPLTLVFVVLIGLAFGASCKGFFVDPTLTSITISPSSPQVELDKTQQLSVFGTYDDGSRKQVKSGVSWSTAPTGIVSIDPDTNIMSGRAVGTTQLTADAQGLHATATATVFKVITDLTISPTTANADQGTSVNFTVKDQADNNVSNLADVVAKQGGTTVTTINCSFDDVENAQVCTIDDTAPTGDYNIVATYPGFSGSATAVLTVTAPN